MRQLLITALLGAGAAALLVLPAHAGRPLQSEDAGVLDRAGCEIEGVHERLRESGAAARGESLTLSCGIGLQSQLGISAARARADGEASARGWAIGGKTQLWRGAGDNAAALTLAWSAAWERSDGRHRHAVDELLLVATLPAGPGQLHLNLGHNRDRLAQQRSAPWGIAYEHEGFDAGAVKLAPMAEFVGDDRGTRLWNVALRATLLPERLFVDASYGRYSGNGRARLFTAGFKLAF